MIKIGDKIPEGKFMIFTGLEFEEVSFPDFLQGKKIVLFGLPGAYTPTCAMRHLPGFVKLADVIKSKGVDEIICIAVNDPFVLRAWAEDEEAEGKVLILSDWNALFTKAMGLDFDGAMMGMGPRSLRYNAVIDDGVLKHIDVEADPGACGITHADEIVKYL
jgi:glutaredoxin/glutathione-dependent peroxiredoxin